MGLVLSRLVRSNQKSAGTLSSGLVLGLVSSSFMVEQKEVKAAETEESFPLPQLLTSLFGSEL